MLVVDDVVLLAVVAERVPAHLDFVRHASDDGTIATTGCWYWRLGRALAHPSGGALSRAIAALGDDERAAAARALASLPDHVELLSLRRLVPVMSALPGQLNMLTAEAVAAAAVLDADLVVTTHSELLVGTAQHAGVAVRQVAIA